MPVGRTIKLNSLNNNPTIMNRSCSWFIYLSIYIYELNYTVEHFT